MSTWQALWHALGPAIVGTTYVLGGLLVYAVRRLAGWRWRDAETESRKPTALLGPELRLGFAWILQPLGALLRASDIPAAALTTLSVALAAGAAVALATGRFALGGWLAIAGGLCDFFDGRLARARGEAGPWGAALDSVLDRYSDALLLGGLAWYWRDTWVLLPALGALSGSLLVSYVRAKSESTGASISEGLMQRAERVACIAATTALTPAFDLLTGDHTRHWLAVAGVTFVAVASQGTAARRFAALLQRLDPRAAHPVSSQRLLWGGIALAVDAALAVLLVQQAHVEPWLATAVGCLLAGVVEAGLVRATVGSRSFVRVAIALLVAALLNAGGVALLQDVLDWRLAWLLARVVTLASWTRTLERSAPVPTSHPLPEQRARMAVCVLACVGSEALLTTLLDGAFSGALP